MPMLQVDSVSRNFEGLQAVQRASFSVEPETVTSLVGPNGAGKTTLFNLISGLLPLTSGEIRFQGRRIDDQPAYRRARAGIGRTFQDPRIFHDVSVLDHILSAIASRAENPLWALLRDRRTRRDIEREREFALGLLADVGLSERATEKAQDLSFGEQRMLSIARVMGCKPNLVLLDEPTVGLDESGIERLIGLMERMVRIHNRTVLLVEHNMSVVFRVSHQIHLMVQGTVVVSGKPEAMRRDDRMIEAYLGRRHAALCA